MNLMVARAHDSSTCHIISFKNYLNKTISLDIRNIMLTNTTKVQKIIIQLLPRNFTVIYIVPFVITIQNTQTANMNTALSTLTAEIYSLMINLLLMGILYRKTTKIC